MTARRVIMLADSENMKRAKKMTYPRIYHIPPRGGALIIGYVAHPPRGLTTYIDQ